MKHNQPKPAASQAQENELGQELSDAESLNTQVDPNCKDSIPTNMKVPGEELKSEPDPTDPIDPPPTPSPPPTPPPPLPPP